MSAMAKMLADMLLKELPEDIRASLTPENFKVMGDKITEFLESQNYIHRAVQHIANEQQELLKTMNRILEYVEPKDVSNEAPSSPRKRRGGSNGSSAITIIGDE